MQFKVRSLVLLILSSFLVPLAMIVVWRKFTAFGVWADVSPLTWTFIAAWYVAFFGFMLLPTRRLAAMAPVPQSDRWVVLFSAIATLGVCMMTYEFVVVRGYDLSLSAQEIRILQVVQANEGFVGSWLGGLGRLFYAALVPAWIVACMRWRRIRWPAILCMLLATLAVFAFQSRFEGGRAFAAALTVAALFACLAYFVDDTMAAGRLSLRSIRVRHLVPVSILGLMIVAITVYSAKVFEARGSYAGDRMTSIMEIERGRAAERDAQQLRKADEALRSAAERLEILRRQQQHGADATIAERQALAGRVDAAARALEEAAAAQRRLEREATTLTAVERAAAAGASPLALSYLQYADDFELDTNGMADLENFDLDRYRLAMTWIYVTQGVNEFDRVLRADDLDLAYGMYQFSQIAQILSKFAGRDLRYPLAENLPNVGTYITLPGASYVDFGLVFSMVFAGLLGFVFKLGLDAIFHRTGSAFAFAAPIIYVIVLFGPLTSLVSGFWPCFFWVAAMPLWQHIARRAGRTGLMHNPVG